MRKNEAICQDKMHKTTQNKTKQHKINPQKMTQEILENCAVILSERSMISLSANQHICPNIVTGSYSGYLHFFCCLLESRVV